MPRKVAVATEEAIAIIKKYIMHFQGDNIPKYSADIWKSISIHLDHKWSPAVVYTNVRQNRRGILSTAREEMGILVRETIEGDMHGIENSSNGIFSLTSESSPSSSTNSDLVLNACEDSSYEEQEKYSNFRLILSEDQWNTIKPNDNEKSLKPNVWANVISIAFASQTKIPCAFVFRRSKICTESKWYLTIIGKCNSHKCGNTFMGYLKCKPQDEEEIVIIVKTRDTRLEKHDVAKRPLNGQRRKVIKKELAVEESSQWLKRLSGENMLIGDQEPTYLPTLNVLREAKREGAYEALGIDKRSSYDLIRAVEDLSVRPEFAGMIKEVGSWPFYVFYNTASQIDSYKKYYKIAATHPTTICIDATGSLVKQITRPNKTKTKHIFLYAIVINFENSTLPIYQMLSERNTTEFIYLWLSKWLRQGVKPPAECICDYSRALLSALSLAFNFVPIKWYINDRFLQLSGSKHVRPVRTFIRIDVAHLIHLIARWKCFRHITHYAIKEFLLRCVGLMVDCANLKMFEEIFLLTVAVAGHQYIDSEIAVLYYKTVAEAKNALESLISERNLEIEQTEEFDNIRPESETKIEFIDVKEEKNEIHFYIDSLVLTAKNITREGKNLNVFYMPNFITSLEKLGREFPLWTATSIPYKTKHATTSYVEGYFNDLKTRTLKKKILRVDAFLVKHLRDISGGTLLFTAKLNKSQSEKEKNKINSEKVPIAVLHKKDCNDNDELLSIQPIVHENIICPDVKITAISSVEQDELPSFSKYDFNIPLNDSDLISIENWRGKGEKEYVHSSSKEDKDEEIFRNNESSMDHSYCATTSNSEQTKKSKYFQTVPEINQINNLAPTNKKRQSLLPNGNLCDIPVTIENKSFLIKSTCAFDSVVHILMCAGLDHGTYKHFLNRSRNPLLKFVSDFIQNGVTKKILADRILLLKNHYETRIGMQTESRVFNYYIDAWDSIANLLTLLMQSAPSCKRLKQCCVCGCREEVRVLLAPNHHIIAKRGFAVLESALEYKAHIYNILCNCGGKYVLKSSLYSHVFIELDIRPNTQLQQGLKCNLRQMPVALKLPVDEEHFYNYRLAGIIAYIPGHFKTYCLRATGCWELYDDLKTKVISCPPNTEIEPHLAIYIKVEN